MLDSATNMQNAGRPCTVHKTKADTCTRTQQPPLQPRVVDIHRERELGVRSQRLVLQHELSGSAAQGGSKAKEISPRKLSLSGTAAANERTGY